MQKKGFINILTHAFCIFLIGVLTIMVVGLAITKDMETIPGIFLLLLFTMPCWMVYLFLDRLVPTKIYSSIGYYLYCIVITLIIIFPIYSNRHLTVDDGSSDMSALLLLCIWISAISMYLAHFVLQRKGIR